MSDERKIIHDEKLEKVYLQLSEASRFLGAKRHIIQGSLNAFKFKFKHNQTEIYLNQMSGSDEMACARDHATTYILVQNRCLVFRRIGKLFSNLPPNY